MARKKPSVESRTHQDHHPHEGSNKMDHLRTLNQLLLKETKERRFLIENLKSQIEELNEEKPLLFDIEREISRLVISSAVAEEIKNRVVLVRERDDIEKGMEAAVSEKDASREEVRLRRKEIGELETRVRVLEAHNLAIGERLELAVAEREELERKARKNAEVFESLREVERERHRADLEVNVEKVSTLEGELRNAVEVKGRLEADVGTMKETINVLKVEESGLRAEVAELEKRNGELERELDGLQKNAGVLEKEEKNLDTQLMVSSMELYELRVKIGEIEQEKEGLRLEIMELERRNGEADRLRVNILEKEKKEMENHFEAKIRESELGSNDLRGKIAVLEQDKDEIEQAKANLELDILQLENEVKNLKSSISELRELSVKYTEKNNQLQALQDATNRELDKQLEEAGCLKLQVEKLTKSREGTLQELKKLQISFDALVSEKEEGKRSIELLSKEKALLVKGLSAAQAKSRDLERKMKATEATSAKALSLLKSTVEAINGSEKAREYGTVVVVDDDDDEISSLVGELECIKTAYRSRVVKMEEMSRELHVMNLRKKGGLSMWLYPATSAVLAAAISFAYAAKVR